MSTEARERVQCCLMEKQRKEKRANFNFEFLIFRYVILNHRHEARRWAGFHAPGPGMCFSPIQALWISITSSEALQSPQLSPSQPPRRVPRTCVRVTGCIVYPGTFVALAPSSLCDTDHRYPGTHSLCTRYRVHNGVYALI